MKEGVVDLSRNRCWGFMDTKEAEIVAEFSKSQVIGVVIFPDSTQMRLFRDSGKREAAEVLVRVSEAYGTCGSAKMAPGLISHGAVHISFFILIIYSGNYLNCGYGDILGICFCAWLQ